ncbi:hypothetical protein D3C84_923350 [compost metagenome]
MVLAQLLPPLLLAVAHYLVQQHWPVHSQVLAPSQQQLARGLLGLQLEPILMTMMISMKRDVARENKKPGPVMPWKRKIWRARLRNC